MQNLSRLNKNQTDVRQVAEAIASVLAVEVTIVDEDLRRIAGTGCFAGTVGDKLDKATVFAQVLREGKCFVIANPREDSACKTCEVKKRMCGVCGSMLSDIIGQKIIVLLHWWRLTKFSGRLYWLNQTACLIFLQRMADLLSSKVVEAERIVQLKNIQQQMTTVLNTVQEGIIAVDRKGIIVDLNTSAAKMLHVDKNEVVGPIWRSKYPAADWQYSGNRTGFQ